MDEVAGAAGPGRAKTPVDKTFRVMTRISRCCWLLICGTGWRPIIGRVGLMFWLSVGWTCLRSTPTTPRFGGAPRYDPRLMLKVLVYGYSHGVTSSRALERRCHDDIAFRFLTAQAAPGFVAINGSGPGTVRR